MDQPTNTTPPPSPTPPPTPPSAFATSVPKSHTKKWFIIGIILAILILGSVIFFFSNQTKTPLATNTVTPTTEQVPSPTTSVPAPTQTQAAKNTWQVFAPADHTFVAPDNSFRFVYPADWAYETIDGIIPQQQHIVNLGRPLTLAERQALAQKAGVELNAPQASINFTTQEVALYYTNTPDFQVTKLEDLATGTILSKKQITVGSVPAIEATVDCPTDCVEIFFTKGQATFLFIIARVFGSSTPPDTKKLEQIIETFSFAQ